MKLIRLFLPVACLFLITVASADPACSAEWIDDWIAQKTTVSPNYIESQKRGYYTPGSVSMRWRRSNDYLVSVAKPKFTTGCGGIDLFLGSFGFLNYDNLVQKLQSIMGPAAATFAFDIALNTLCSPCAEEITKLEAIIDRLNQIQIDDCKAQQTIVATLEKHSGIANAAKTNAYIDFIQETGLKSLYKEIVEEGDGKTTDQVLLEQGGTSQAPVAGCPTELTNTFFKQGSLLENLADQKYMSQNYVDLMRALVGDVAISADLNYNFIEPCDNVSPGSLEDVIYGELRTRDINTLTCTRTNTLVVNGTNYTSLRDWVYKKLTSIATALIDQEALTAEDQAFINSLPGPILIAIQNEIQRQGQNATAADVAALFQDFAVVSYAYSTFKNLYDSITQLFYTADTIVFNKKGTASGDQQATCQLALKNEAYTLLKSMQDNVRKYQLSIADDYDKYVQSFISQMQLARYILDSGRGYNEQATKELAHGIKER